MGKTQILGTVAIVPKGDWQENTSYELLNLIRYEGASYLAIRNVPENTLPTDVNYWQLVATDGVANINLENGEGDYSVVQKTAEGEENQATAEGTYAGGKKSKTTAKRGFTHGNTVVNNGNSAASFGQGSENNGNVALTQGADYYNGGDLAVLVGGKLYNVDGPYWATPNNNGGAAAALFGTFIYNRGSHSLSAGYLIKNTRSMSVKLGRANENKENNLFELGVGKYISVTKHDGYNTFVYKNGTYIINYEGENAVSITHPDSSVWGLGNSFRTHLQDGNEICIGGNINTPQVFLPYNIFEIDELGTIVAQGGLHVKKAGSLAEMELESDGLRVQGKGQFDGKVSGDTGDFAHGLDVNTRGLAKFRVYDNGAEVTGNLTVSNAPSRPTDVVRLEDLPAGGGKTYYKHSVEIDGVLTGDVPVAIIYIPTFISSSSTAIETFEALKENCGDFTPVTFHGPFNPQGGGFGTLSFTSQIFSGRMWNINNEAWQDFYGTITYSNITDTVIEL